MSSSSTNIPELSIPYIIIKAKGELATAIDDAQI
jgi:hypothetical protein